MLTPQEQLVETQWHIGQWGIFNLSP